MKVEQAVREYDQALLQQVADHLLGERHSLESVDFQVPQPTGTLDVHAN